VSAERREVPETLRTERLLLRRWTPGDADAFAAMNADPAVMAHIGPPLTRPQSDAFLERIAKQFDAVGYGLWAVEVREGGLLAGFTGLAILGHAAPTTSSVEVGWRLVRDAWGHGYATEAAAAAVDLAFGPLALDELVSITTPDNLRSQAVMRRLGMQRARELDVERERLANDDPLRPAVVHRLARASWRPHQE
jgi:RimJ/RimL family protein N-acetyltransferase